MKKPLNHKKIRVTIRIFVTSVLIVLLCWGASSLIYYYNLENVIGDRMYSILYVVTFTTILASISSFIVLLFLILWKAFRESEWNR